MGTVEHWLYGKCEFEELIDKETDCSTCIHVKVCKVIWIRIGYVPMEDICINHYFSCSKESCENCIHKFTRYDNKQSIPCFKCKFYKENKEKV